MPTVATEVYDVFREMGASDEQARRAAAVLAGGDTGHQRLLLEFEKLRGEFEKLKGEFEKLKGEFEKFRGEVNARFAGIEGRIDRLGWMCGINITLTLLVLGKLFLL